MRTETYSTAPRYIPQLSVPAPPVSDEDGFTLAAPQRPTASALLARVDWTALGVGFFVYAVAFAAWTWLVR